MSFRSTHRPRSKISRQCPECREPIEPGTRYVRWACVTLDYGFCTGFHCVVCEEISELYFKAARTAGQSSWDEVTYDTGELISEAAQTADLYWNKGWHQCSLLDQREDVVIALRAQVSAERSKRRLRSIQRAWAAQMNRWVRARQPAHV